MTATWVRRGERKRVPYENPRRRRLNVLAATVATRATAELYWMPSRRHLDADDLLDFLRDLPPAPVPTVVVLDNANFHRAHVVRDARPELRRRGIFLHYLPPYSPELNDIERLFRTVKHHELPERTYPTLDHPEDAVNAAFARCEARLATKHANSPGKAA